ncbi:MAG: thioredoxin-dependent thiol peroxidase [Catalinimonas sp.]
MSPQAGDAAPAFEAPDQQGQTHRLEDYRGKKVALYFYPKDDTPGCTKQACNLRDNREVLRAAGWEVLGVSVDDERSHQQFSTKYDLNFPLLADPGRHIVEAYGVWKEKSMYGRKYMGTARTTFLIDEEGVITKVIGKPKVSEHAAEILK